jgi:hypothetical protein
MVGEKKVHWSGAIDVHILFIITVLLECAIAAESRWRANNRIFRFRFSDGATYTIDKTEKTDEIAVSGVNITSDGVLLHVF